MALTILERGGPDPIDLTVGVKLRAIRQERRMSQSQLGDALGITFQQVQKYERGSNRVSASMLVKAAKALGVEPSAMLPDSVAMGGSASNAALDILANVRGAPEMLAAFARMQPRIRREMLQFARALALDEQD